MKKSTLLSALYLVSLSLSAQSWSLAWKDEFIKNGLLDSTYWSFSEGKYENDGIQYFKAGSLQKTRVSEDHLYLQLRNDIENDISIYSSRIHTKGKISFQGGRLELKAKMPNNVSILTAFGLRSTREDSASFTEYGEIKLNNQIENHHGKLAGNIYIGGSNQYISNDPADYVQLPHLNYHIYAIEWDEGSIKLIFDNKIFYKHQRDGEDWPFTKPMYFFIDMKIAEEAMQSDMIDQNFSQQLVIDYVRYFRKHEKDLSVQK